ncbi:uncharacterized protein LOC62_07G009742 [Vanrija pseudolonga]|uniref:Uncharacterized protein n=1 Tax=Vanrija pseudolonga TaxID=143232 RepID=A0AAF0YMI5_9TREE|nr:hypothetical protein LOC62_07G009742 [Vanrija pseudolonga]
MDALPSQLAQALQSVQPVQVQPSPRRRAGLASLPANVLWRICEETLGIYDWRGRDDRRQADTLSQCCKALRATLAEAEHLRAAFHTVSILPSPDGLRFLAGLAAGPYARHVRHVTIARQIPVPGLRSLRAATLALLGFGPGSEVAVDDHGVDGMETPLARQLADVFCALPSLEGAGVGLGYVPLPRKSDGQASGFKEPRKKPDKMPFGQRTVLSGPTDDYIHDVIFRGVLSSGGRTTCDDT